MAELVVSHEFMLGAKWYSIGQHVTEADEVEAIIRDRPQFVRAVAPQPAPQNGEPLPLPAPATTQE